MIAGKTAILGLETSVKNEKMKSWKIRRLVQLVTWDLLVRFDI